MSRPEALARYRALPLPTKTDDPWRFTDLAGFDPDSYTANGAAAVASSGSMLEIDASGVASVSEAGVTIERAPEGIVFEPLPEDAELLYGLVGSDEKVAAHNAALLDGVVGVDERFPAHTRALWKAGPVVRVPKGVGPEQPLYVRITGSVEG